MLIEGRFNGPSESGNGGYSAGVVARALAPAPDLAARVTLRLPPPLDTPLQAVRPAESSQLLVYAGERLVAEAEPVGLDQLGEPVPPVPYPQAVAVAQDYPGFTEHPFPRCYVCGPQRAEGDGLRIFPGPLPDGGTAAPWHVPPDVSELTVWAALDCPGGWSILAGSGRPYVLGRIAARVNAIPAPGSNCLVTGDVIEAAGRKAEVRSALYASDAAGEPLAYARATWIAI